MTDLDAFVGAARESQRRTGVPCGGALVSERGRLLITAALAAGVRSKAISATLADPVKGTGESIPDETIRRHFVRRDCRCWG